MDEIRTRTDCAVAVVRVINGNGGVNPDVFEISPAEYQAVMADFEKDGLKIRCASIDRPNFLILSVPVVAALKE